MLRYLFGVKFLKSDDISAYLRKPIHSLCKPGILFFYAARMILVFFRQDIETHTSPILQNSVAACNIVYAKIVLLRVQRIFGSICVFDITSLINPIFFSKHLIEDDNSLSAGNT